MSQSPTHRDIWKAIEKNREEIAKLNNHYSTLATDVSWLKKEFCILKKSLSSIDHKLFYLFITILGVLLATLFA